MKVYHIDIYETCLPRGFVAKCRENGKSWYKTAKAETLDQFRNRIMSELHAGVIFYFQ